MSESNTADWVRVLKLGEIPVGAARLVRARDQRIAVYRTEEDAVFAVDNRCPHEGYPLSEGQVHGGRILVCAWHGFTFDLKNGRCLGGDEDVRSYPARIVDAQIEVDVSEPPQVDRVPQLYASLTEALLERRPGQVARDLIRLMRAGVPSERLVAEAALFDARHGEFGVGHAMPVAFDVLAMLPRFPGSAAVAPMLLAMEAASVPNARRPQRTLHDPIDPGDDPQAAGGRLQAAAQRLDVREVEGLLRGALARGWTRDVIEPWLFGVCAHHFLGFGHALIYQTKAFDLLDRVGWKEPGAEALLCAHAFVLAIAPREELIPTERRLRDALAELDERADALWAAQSDTPLTPEDEAELLGAVLDGTDEQALGAVLRRLERGVSRHEIARVWVLAAAERLLRFDLDVERSADVQDGWLDIVHLFTFSSAVRVALARYDEAESLRWLLFGARFIQRARPCDRTTLDPLEQAASAELDTLVGHVRARRTDAAVAHARAYLESGASIPALRAALERIMVDDHGTRSIVVAHHVKVTTAAFDEVDRLSGPQRFKPLLGAIRFLSAPAHEGSLARLVHDAQRFIEQGKTPRRLMV